MRRHCLTLRCEISWKIQEETETAQIFDFRVALDNLLVGIQCGASIQGDTKYYCMNEIWHVDCS